MEKYDLELRKAVAEIKKNNSKLVLIQLPDGLKQMSDKIQEYIEKNTKANVVILGGSCFGACDVPFHVKNLGVDLIISWGYSAWRF